jgi:hypothetical protein
MCRKLLAALVIVLTVAGFDPAQPPLPPADVPPPALPPVGPPAPPAPAPPEPELLPAPVIVQPRTAPPPEASPAAPPAQPLPARDAHPDDGDAGLGGSLRGSEEYLLWWMKSAPLPPLATRNAFGASPALGTVGTRTLIDGPADLGERSGGRFMAVLPFNESHTVGLEGGYFFLGTRTETLLAAGTNAPGAAAVGRPYIDAATGREAVSLIAAPGFLAGEFRAASSARAQGAELNLVTDLLHGRRWQIDGLVGYRFLQVYEGLGLGQQGLVIGPGAAGVTAFGRHDQFDAHNDFHGGQLGLRGDLRKGPLFVELTGKVAFGVSNEVVKVGGETAYLMPGFPLTVQPGGLLALPSNSGRATREAFAVVPEAMARVGFNWGENARFFVGYNFLALNDAVRPGDQIDRTVNADAIPFSPRGLPPTHGPERPLLAVHPSEVWLQGLMLGFEGKW